MSWDRSRAGPSRFPAWSRPPPQAGLCCQRRGASSWTGWWRPVCFLKTQPPLLSLSLASKPLDRSCQHPALKESLLTHLLSPALPSCFIIHCNKRGGRFREEATCPVFETRANSSFESTLLGLALAPTPHSATLTAAPPAHVPRAVIQSPCSSCALCPRPSPSPCPPVLVPSPPPGPLLGPGSPPLNDKITRSELAASVVGISLLFVSQFNE